jgi:hypothetical protein
MKIELNKKQYRDLIELLFLGNWVANASRTGAEGDDMLEKYEEIFDYILSHAKSFEADDVVMQEDKRFYTTMDFDESIMPVIEDYDDYTFWEQLSSKLAERDLLRELGPISFKEEHQERMFDIEEQYEIEFEKNGLKNLTLVKPEKKKK